MQNSMIISRCAASSAARRTDASCKLGMRCGRAARTCCSILDRRGDSARLSKMPALRNAERGRGAHVRGVQGMLDDGDLPAAASGDDEADDLDDYLHELEAADDEGGGGGAGEAAGEDVAKYLEDLGLDDGDDGATAASPAGAGKSD